jgi:hypothetical protein
MTIADSLLPNVAPDWSPAIDEADHAYLAPLFRGPSGESGSQMETLLTGFLCDLADWRRNFHPEVDAVVRDSRIGACAGTFVTQVTDPDAQADHLLLIRHTLMSPWLRVVSYGESYLDRYCRFLLRHRTGSRGAFGHGRTANEVTRKIIDEQ